MGAGGGVGAGGTGCEGVRRTGAGGRATQDCAGPGGGGGAAGGGGAGVAAGAGAAAIGGGVPVPDGVATAWNVQAVRKPAKNSGAKRFIPRRPRTLRAKTTTALQAADSHRFGRCIGKNVTQPKYSLHAVTSGYRSCRRSYRLTTVISDSTPCAGQPLLVAATATDPTNGSLPVAISINGSPGSPQLVQLMAPAPARRI